MLVTISSWYLETVISILENGDFQLRYDVVSQEGGTVVLKFGSDKLKREVDSWIDNAKGCELIYRGNVVVP